MAYRKFYVGEKTWAKWKVEERIPEWWKEMNEANNLKEQ